MAEDIYVNGFDLPEAFTSAFISAHGSDSRMQIVEQFFECQEVALGADGTLELKPNLAHQVYLIGSTSLMHVEQPGPADTLYVVQPLPGKRGKVDRRGLEQKIVSQMRQGRKLWLLTRKAAAHSPSSPQPSPDGRDDAAVSAIHPDEIVPETSSIRLSADEDATSDPELDLRAFDQLRSVLQNVRLHFWNGDARSQPTESVTVAQQKAEEHDITGAIQVIEMLDNVFVRFIEHWQHDFHEAERRMKRGRGDADPAKFKTLKEHHLEMQSRIAQAKTKFRIMLNWLREAESKQQHRKPAS